MIVDDDNWTVDQSLKILMYTTIDQINYQFLIKDICFKLLFYLNLDNQ